MSSLKSTLICAFAIMICNSCASEFGKKVNGNGDVITISHKTSNYDALNLSGWMDFELVEGKEGEITLTGESNLLDYILVESNGNTLTITTKNNTNIKPSLNKTIKISIPIEDISEVSLSGSGDVTSKKPISASTFKSKISGSGDIVLTINSKNTDASVTGSGDLTLNGRSENLEVSVTGSGNFHGFNLNTSNVDAKVTGSGDVDILASHTLKARVTGSGDITCKGTPKNIDQKITGSGDITFKN